MSFELRSPLSCEISLVIYPFAPFILAVHLLIMQVVTWISVLSSASLNLLWVAVDKVTLFRGHSFINATRLPLRAFNAEVTGSFTIALSPCSHSCPPTLVLSFGNDGEGCFGWCIALSFHDTISPRTWRSSAIPPNSFGPSLVILGHFPLRPRPLSLIFEIDRGTQILWPHKYFKLYKWRV